MIDVELFFNFFLSLDFAFHVRKFIINNFSFMEVQIFDNLL